MIADSPVEVFQSEYEFSNLYNIIKSIKPTKVVEIGSLFGGTLWHWMNLCEPGSTFVSIDLMVPNSDNRYKMQQFCHNRLWYEWANNFDHKLQVIEGKSQDPKVLETMYTKYKPVDFLFIDGDHTYNAVRQDFQNYLDLVRPGGVIAFHDIAIPEEDSIVWGGVSRLWKEIKESNLYVTEEFIEKPRWWGIGIVYKPLF